MRALLVLQEDFERKSKEVRNRRDIDSMSDLTNNWNEVEMG